MMTVNTVFTLAEARSFILIMEKILLQHNVVAVQLVELNFEETV
jgi:hypothetical protein